MPTAIYPAGKADFALALEKDPAFEPAARNLAALALRDNDLATAERVWRGVVGANGDSVPALVSLAQLRVRQGDTDEYRSLLRQASLAGEQTPLPHYLLAQQLLADGNIREAGDVVDSALKRLPDAISLMVMKARVHLAEGRPKSARQQGDRVRAILAERRYDLSKAPSTAVTLGSLFLASGDRDAALDALRAANDGYKGQDPDTLILLSRLLIAEADTLGGRQALSSLRKLEVNPRAVLELEGDLLVAEDKLDEALKKYSDLAGLGVRAGTTKQAMVLERQGQQARALELMEGWVEENPTDYGMKLLIANSHLTAGAPTDARAIYEELISLDNPIVLNNLAWLYHEQGDEKALDLARRARELAPENPDIADTLGWILVQAGEVNEGLSLLQASAEEREQNPSVQYHLGAAHEKLGDNYRARVYLRRALNLGKFPEADAARALLDSL